MIDHKDSEKAKSTIISDSLETTRSRQADYVSYGTRL